MKHIIPLLLLLFFNACNNAANNQQTTSIPSADITSSDTACHVLTSEDSKHNSNLSTINPNLLLGKFTPATDSNFVLIPNHMSTYKGLYCERQTFAAYLAMRDSALREGITLTIISATRNFDRQRQIWEQKWNSFKTQDTRHETQDTTLDITKIRSIMRYSSMPGTSRHHWGTELDFISAETKYWTHGEGLRIYNWLCANAHKFGFFQPYTADPTRTGYAEERWHWSYAPLSKLYLEAYLQTITPTDITGFSGSYLIDSLNIIQSHVLGIAQ